MKKISIILAFMMLIPTFCSCQWKEEIDESLFSYESISPGELDDSGTYYYGFTYIKYEDSHVVISGYKGADPNAIVPAEIEGLPVTEIADRAFSDNTYITSATIPSSITKIGEKAFSGCSSLVNVTVEGVGLTSIGDQAFYGTPYIVGNKTEFLTIGNGILINYCGSNATVTVPEGVTVIAGAFENNAFLTEVILPSTLTTIGSYSFNGCSKLESINIPDSVTKIGQWAFAKCASLKSVIIPDSVTSIGAKSFLLCDGLSSITLSSKIVNIPDSAFQACKSLTEVTIPASVSVIDDNAFIRCTSLTKITIPDSVVRIGEMVFSECAEGLTVHCPEGSYAEEYCIGANIPTISEQ